MKRSFLAVLATAALLATALAAPTAGADHCASKITVYSRVSGSGAPVPPATSGTLRNCTHLAGQSHDDAVLLPMADQVLVRFHADLGPSVPTLPVVLDGLGFVNRTFVMGQVQTAQGTWVYQMAGWESIPDANAEGELKATVTVPSGTFTVTYRTF